MRWPGLGLGRHLLILPNRQERARCAWQILSIEAHHFSELSVYIHFSDKEAEAQRRSVSKGQGPQGWQRRMP